MDFSTKGVDVPWAQIDFLLNDYLTAVVGRYLVPIGFYNERLSFEWGNKMPDDPLMFHQVSPLASTAAYAPSKSRAETIPTRRPPSSTRTWRT